MSKLSAYALSLVVLVVMFQLTSAQAPAAGGTAAGGAAGGAGAGAGAGANAGAAADPNCPFARARAALAGMRQSIANIPNRLG